MKKGRVKGGSIIPAVIDTGRRKRSSMAQPIRNMAGSTRGIIGGAAQNIIEITNDDLVQNGGNYSLKGGTPIPMQIVTGRRSKQGAAQVVYPVDALGNYDPTFAGYIHKVLTADEDSGYDPSSLIQFLPQNELAGGVSLDYSGLGNNGAYTGVTLGQPGVPGMGMSAAGYDGATSFNNVYSASLNAAFNGAEGTILIWAQVPSAAVWADGVAGRAINIAVDGANIITIRKNAANQLQWFYIAGGVAENINEAGVTTLNYMALGLTWSATADQVIAYRDGAPVGAPATILGAWAGNLLATECVVGAQTTAPGQPWEGNLAPALVFNDVKTPAEMLYLSTV